MVADRRSSIVLTIHVVGETGSTNADLLAAAAAGAADGTWLRAERQVAGRGRLGRNWSDGAGNLFASTVVRPGPHDPAPHTLTLVAAVALAQAVSTFAPRLAAIKWPNDLIVGDAKLSGILLERSDTAIVIGFGANIASHPALAERATTCLAAHGVDVDAATLLDALRDRFSAWLATWRQGDLAAVRTAWEAAAHPVGTPLRVRLPDGGEQAGRFGGLDADGALRLSIDGGRSVVVHAGDVFV